MTFSLDELFSPEQSELAADHSAACTEILDIIGRVGAKHGIEQAMWLILATAAIAARAVNVTPTQASGATRLIRKNVDRAVDRIGPDSATASDIMNELHLPTNSRRK